jgi:6-phosphogluconolactonase
MARNALFDHVPLPAANIHRMRGEEEPDQAAVAYAAEIRLTFGGDAIAGGPPPGGFDLILLGLGSNGHTARSSRARPS